MSYPYTPPPSAPYPPPYGNPYGNPYGGPPGGPYRRPEARSAIPRVVGILAIVFSAIGIFISLAMTFGPKSDFRFWEITQSDLGFFGTWLDIYLVLACAVFLLHLIGGITIVAYKRSGPPLITAYAIAALILLVLDIAISMTVSPPEAWMYSDLAFPRLFIEIVALPWPVIAVILVNVRKAKEACGRYPKAED